MSNTRLTAEFTGCVHDGLLMRVTRNTESIPQDIFFRSSDIELVGNADTCLAAGLLPAMRLKADLVVPGKVSRRLFESLRAIVGFYRAWEPALANVTVEGAQVEPRVEARADRVAAYFSGGVDSFYTLLKHLDEITDIVFVHGFDVPLRNDQLRCAVSQMLRSVGTRLGKRVIEIETNLKDLLSQHLGWGFTHGAALAAVGHLMAPYFRRLYIAASHTYADDIPWGSHPDLDMHWSSESLEFVHDGCDVGRIEKVRLISQSDVAMQTLRVCFRTPTDALNCGRCEKCLRTMINLKIAGALERCKTFETALEPDQIARLLAPDDSTRAFFEENLRALEGNDAEQPLYNALLKVVRRPRWKTRTLRFLRNPVSDTVSILRDTFPTAHHRIRHTYHTISGRR